MTGQHSIERTLLRLDRVDAALRDRLARNGFADQDAAGRLRLLTEQGASWLRTVIAEHGWPGRRLVGDEAADAASGWCSTWRASWGALEPLPRPRESIDIQPGQRVQANHPVVRMPNEHGWICAVNGYAFTVGRAADEVFARLRTGEPVPVGALCAGHRGEAVRALLAKLYTLRGIDVVEEN